MISEEIQKTKELLTSNLGGKVALLIYYEGIELAEKPAKDVSVFRKAFDTSTEAIRFYNTASKEGLFHQEGILGATVALMVPAHRLIQAIVIRGETDEQ